VTVPDSIAPPTSAVPTASMPTAPCEACGQVFDLRGASCPKCAFQRAGMSSTLGPRIGGKKPRTAMWLSLGWPGAGHFYAGDAEKGAIFSAAAVVCLLLSATIVGPVLGMLLWLGVALHTAIDSGRVVDARSARR
jgi:TM2 domain-containing membrane protein YozV